MTFVFEKIDTARARTLASRVNLPLISGGNQTLIDRECGIELYSLGGGGSYPQRGDDPPSLWCFMFQEEAIALATRHEFQMEHGKNVAYIHFEIFSIPPHLEREIPAIKPHLQKTFTTYLSHSYRSEIAAKLIFPDSNLDKC
ncbi:hypothetical protein RF679_01175 [Undibacterium cyanobacteriorum]|uniref:Uncharacterized protein n=1 Tax=Undibacterium cyanobacteriorum TaxID=3073561 RepID=A0ABY9RJB6_9BURK|nr:hypothetical protein [Undibacterium sp. 20NA77.5]WMW80908.1 hypothetical protein RF679_01175 [Undibacterium sp. 20NA77.5]